MGTKIGRPRKRAAERLSKFFRVRLSPEDYKTVVDAIQKSDEDQSDWIRDALLTKATPRGGCGDTRG